MASGCPKSAKSFQVKATPRPRARTLLMMRAHRQEPLFLRGAAAFIGGVFSELTVTNIALFLTIVKRAGCSDKARSNPTGLRKYLHPRRDARSWAHLVYLSATVCGCKYLHPHAHLFERAEWPRPWLGASTCIHAPTRPKARPRRPAIAARRRAHQVRASKPARVI